MRISTTPFRVNGLRYRPPAKPLAVVCIDGCGPEYLEVSRYHGRMPHLDGLAEGGFETVVRGALPSFTNVNNACIVSGVPPSVTGISGNFFLDPRTGRQLMMNSSRYVRCDTILAAAARAGRKVAMVTAKEKLRDLLTKDLDGIAFSSERAAAATVETHGIENLEDLVGRPQPEIYSADASLFVLAAGARLIRRNLADFLFLSLTDYMQHKCSPESARSLDFHQALDREIGALLETGARVGVTADHGMNAKTRPDGSPNVVYLESLLRDRFGEGTRVVCPITDPYVVHHGSLGSSVMVHLAESLETAAVADWIRRLPGIDRVYDRTAASRELDLPADRIGDLVVMADAGAVIGRSPADHDLSVLNEPLRSHGGRHEVMVPMLLSEPLSGEYEARAAQGARNYEIFDYLCNGVQDRAGKWKE